MSNSNLVNYIKLSPNCTKPRKNKITKIVIHHMAGNLTVEACGNVFANTSRQASSNYGIGTDGRVGMYVEECNRAWTSGNATVDNQAITIEVANDTIGGNWHVSDKALTKTIELCADICKRNNIERLIFTGDKNGNLVAHRYYQATACPGEYLYSKFPYIAEEVNKLLGTKPASTSSNQAITNPTENTYTVQKGDTLSKIGSKTGIAWRTIADLNGIKSPYVVKVGQVLKLSNTATTNSNNFNTSCKKYISNGIDYSLVFDPTYYSNKYGDLKKTFGTNEDKLFSHFISYGMKEGRQAISTFNVTVYKNRYTDLQKAFGNNLPDYYKHFCQFGKKEGRSAV